MVVPLRRGGQRDGGANPECDDAAVQQAAAAVVHQAPQPWAASRGRMNLETAYSAILIDAIKRRVIKVRLRDYRDLKVHLLAGDALLRYQNYEQTDFGDDDVLYALRADLIGDDRRLEAKNRGKYFWEMDAGPSYVWRGMIAGRSGDVAATVAGIRGRVKFSDRLRPRLVAAG